MACTALLVEDDADIRESLTSELVELGCAVVTSESGVDAMQRLHGGLRPDFILLDLLLPEMSGTQMLRALKSELVLSTIPVVLMSASRVSAVLQDKSPAQHVLQKPLRRWQLEQIVEWFGGTAGVARRSGSEPA